MPLSGMYNKSGGKVRLTFKLEQDQLWIGTKGTACSRLWPPVGSGLVPFRLSFSDLSIHLLCVLLVSAFAS